MSASGTPAPGQHRAHIFLRRFFSTVVLWTLILAALFSGHRHVADHVFVVIMMTLAGTGLVEFYRLARQGGLACFPGWGVAGGLLLMAGTFLHFQGHLGIHGTPARVNDFETSFLILFVLGLCVRQLCAPRNPDGLPAIATTLFGLMYVPWLLNFIQKIHFFPGISDQGKYFVLYFVLVTKSSDTGAYVLGSLVGRHKLLPRLSPNKTWEGLAGALLLSTGASLLFVHYLGDRMTGMNVRHAVILGVMLGLAAVVGDLIESLFKREAGVKDSGRWFPGIGGVLDLLDSLLFNAPIMYVYLRHVLTHPG